MVFNLFGETSIKSKWQFNRVGHGWCRGLAFPHGSCLLWIALARRYEGVRIIWIIDSYTAPPNSSHATNVGDSTLKPNASQHNHIDVPSRWNCIRNTHDGREPCRSIMWPSITDLLLCSGRYLHKYKLLRIYRMGGCRPRHKLIVALTYHAYCVKGHRTQQAASKQGDCRLNQFVSDANPTSAVEYRSSSTLVGILVIAGPDF